MIPGPSPAQDAATSDQTPSPSAVISRLPDLRFGIAPTIRAAPGIDPAGDARALVAPGTQSIAGSPIAGVLVLYEQPPGRRHVLRIPDAWNGSLVVAGTPGTRSEFANDLIWSDFALARGYAFASSNKGIPYNTIVEPTVQAASHGVAYPIPFDLDGLESNRMAMRLGVLTPQPIGIASWNDDFQHLIEFARLTVRFQRGSTPKRIYAVGLSNGGAQVRSALESFPDLLDGGVDWAGVRWTPERNLLDLLPPFLAAMPGYVSSAFSNHEARIALEAAGFPADVVQNDLDHPSLWCEYYSNALPFYNDLSLFIYALLIDPQASAQLGLGAPIPDHDDPRRLPGVLSAGGLAQPELRADYTPSSQARDAVGVFAHTGAIQRPLISIAGTKDLLITPDFHAAGYAKSVADAGCAHLHRLYLVESGTHCDAFVGFGYGLQAQLPFAWAAFDKLVRTVEHGDASDLGTTRTLRAPSEME